MPDYTALVAEWDDLLTRRSSLRESLQLWTLVLSGWLRWKQGVPPPLSWSLAECAERWERGAPLLAECHPDIPRVDAEDLLGPVMEQLARHAPEAAAGFQRFASGWDAEEIGPENLLPHPGRDPVSALAEAFGIDVQLVAFFGPAATRPALENYFERVRTVPDGMWARGTCAWCGGFPNYGDLIEDGRRRLGCMLCGGAWIAPRLKCPFCDTWNSRDVVRLVAEGSEEGYFIEACRACRGYLKGVDRRQRWNAGSPLVEDWGSPHLDAYASAQGYWRSTPCLAHLVSAGR
jgi:formate dehydrogenase formation protein